MASAYSGNFGSVFHKILGAIWQDESEKNEPIWKQYLEEKTTIKKYFDDVELVSPGLWSETDEGADIDLDDYSQGVIVRYEPKKLAKRLIIPEELEEDSQYPEIYDATRLLTQTCYQTQDYDAVQVLNDAFAGAIKTTGDAIAYCSASHVIRGGGTVSNVLSPALSISNTAVQAMLIVAEKMPGTNGFITPVKGTKLVGPTNLKWRAREILKSELKDDTANHAINALKGDMSEFVGVPYMSSTTNWFMKTNVMRGAMWFWRRKPRFRQSNVETSETKQFTGSARWDKGVTNFRTFVGSNA
jgi:hypothetical protein